MIKTNTVFILGAGTSCPYDYPSSKALTERVWKSILDDQGSASRMINKELPNYDFSVFQKMATELRDSQVFTFDEWLARNETYIDYGKICIAREIIKCEYPNLLPEDKRWYSDLWNTYLLEGCDSVEKIKDNNISFVTFNYDRSLEYYLYKMIRNTFSQVKEEVIVDVLNSFKIIHVHGVVGKVQWQCDAGELARPYKNTDNWSVARKASETIKIIAETEVATEEYIEARRLLAEAEQIYFLGFGYHRENLIRLKRKMGEVALKAHIIKGSAYHLDQRDLESIINKSKNPFGFGISLGHVSDDVVSYLKNNLPRE